MDRDGLTGRKDQPRSLSKKWLVEEIGFVFFGNGLPRRGFQRRRPAAILDMLGWTDQ
jgi:hypothetical protein